MIKHGEHGEYDEDTQYLTRSEPVGAEPHVAQNVGIDGLSVDIVALPRAGSDAVAYQGVVAGTYTTTPATQHYYVNAGAYHAAGAQAGGAHATIKAADRDILGSGSKSVDAAITAAKRAAKTREIYAKYAATAEANIGYVNNFDDLDPTTAVEPGDIVSIHSHGRMRIGVAYHVTKTGTVQALVATPSGGYAQGAKGKHGQDVRVIRKATPAAPAREVVLPPETTPAAAEPAPAELMTAGEMVRAMSPEGRQAVVDAAHADAIAAAPAVTVTHTRLSVATAIKTACGILGLSMDVDASVGPLAYRIDGGPRRTPREACDYLFAGGWDAAYGAASLPDIHQDRLDEAEAADYAALAAPVVDLGPEDAAAALNDQVQQSATPEACADLLVRSRDLVPAVADLNHIEHEGRTFRQVAASIIEAVHGPAVERDSCGLPWVAEIETCRRCGLDASRHPARRAGTDDAPAPAAADEPTDPAFPAGEPQAPAYVLESKGYHGEQDGEDGEPLHRQHAAQVALYSAGAAEQLVRTIGAQLDAVNLWAAQALTTDQARGLREQLARVAAAAGVSVREPLPCSGSGVHVPHLWESWLAGEVYCAGITEGQWRRDRAGRRATRRAAQQDPATDRCTYAVAGRGCTVHPDAVEPHGRWGHPLRTPDATPVLNAPGEPADAPADEAGEPPYRDETAGERRERLAEEHAEERAFQAAIRAADTDTR